MIIHFLPRSQWERKLRELGAEPAEGLGKLNTAEWWRIPGRAPFTVPVEDGDVCEFWAIQTLCEQLGGKPKFDPPLTPDR